MFLRKAFVRAGKFVKNGSRIALYPFAYAYFALEYFFLLLPHIGSLRRADVVYPLWFWSFGHQAIDLHMLSMRFRNKKALVLLSDYRNFNPYIVDSFRLYLEIRHLKHTTLMKKLRPLLRMNVMKVRKVKFAVLRFVVMLCGSPVKILPEYHERQGSVIEGMFITERLRLFAENPDMRITPPAEAIERFREILRTSHPEYADKWFVSLYLRKKEEGRKEIRDTDPASFGVIIDRITELGGFVLCGGDYDPHNVFPGKSGVLGYKDFPCDHALKDIFFITQCRFLVCPAGGSAAIAISYNIPALITNDAIYYHSGSRANEIVLYKKLREKATGRILSARETFSLPIIAYRSNQEFEKAGLEHIDNTAEEIKDATEEMLQRYILGNEIVRPEHGELYKRFRSLLPKESVVYQTPACPALSYLQNMIW